MSTEPGSSAICHRSHVRAVKNPGLLFRHRIQRVAYFGGGADRAVNSWHRECDAVIVAGTPRVRPEVIREYLARIHRFDAARTDGDWGSLTWKGFTASGHPRIVEGLGYRHPDWQQAHRAHVRANIIQAAGRGRGIRETGCDVLILSTEEAGFPLTEPAQDVVEMPTGVVDVLTALIGTISYNTILGVRSDTASLCLQLGTTDRTARKWLTQLESRGLVCRFGERGGWQLTEAGAALAADNLDFPPGIAH